MSFAHPWLLLGLGLLPAWWWYRRRHGLRAGAGYSDTASLLAATSPTWISRVPEVLRHVTLAALIVAAAGPRLAGRNIEIQSEGIAIVLAVDVSSSMLAEDFTPSNRLDVAIRRSNEFVAARPHDRIGLVAFAAEALTQVPVTVDHAVLARAVDSLRVGMLEDGTAIGMAIATAANRLARVPGESRVLILLTDGENNRGSVDPRTAAEAAAQFGIRVYTIGVGTHGEARVPTGRGLSGLRYQMLPVRIDEELLTDIAVSTGGRYFRATDAESLARIYEQIDQLEKVAITSVRFVRHAEVFRWPLALALLAAALEILISSTLVIRVP